MADAVPQIEVVEALRDAITFIRGQARLHQNEGTPAAQKRADVCNEKAAALYPVYARLTGCDRPAEQVSA